MNLFDSFLSPGPIQTLALIFLWVFPAVVLLTSPGARKQFPEKDVVIMFFVLGPLLLLFIFLPDRKRGVEEKVEAKPEPAHVEDPDSLLPSRRKRRRSPTPRQRKAKAYYESTARTPRRRGEDVDEYA